MPDIAYRCLGLQSQRWFKFVLLCGVLAITTQSSAEAPDMEYEEAPPLEAFEDGVNQTILATGEILFPSPPKSDDLGPLNPELSCEVIYATTNELLERVRYQTPGFFENPVNGFLASMGLNFPLAWLLMAGPEVSKVRASTPREQIRLQIEALRQLSASKGCWARE